MIVATRTFSVGESAHDVFTGMNIVDGDRIVITARGEIWAGVWLTGNNDANGWPDHHANSNSPLPGAPPFALLAKLGRSGRFFLVGKNFDRVVRGSSGELVLRINDDVPANGNGSFSVTVEQSRNPAPLSDGTITVRESDRDVDTGIDIGVNDRVAINASGFIWAGVWFTGENGPDGWVGQKQTNSNAPLTGVAPFSLLAKIGRSGRYFFVGRIGGVTNTSAAGRLFLRINDDAPGNGNGQFACQVQVFREPPPVDISFTGTGTLTLRNSNPDVAAPHSGTFSGTLTFSGTREQVDIRRFTPIVATVDTPLGRDTITVSLERSGRGSFNTRDGSLVISTDLLLTNTIVLAGTTRMHYDMTTGNSRNGSFNVTGAVLNRAASTIRIVGTSTARGGFLDGSECSLVLDLRLASLP